MKKSKKFCIFMLLLCLSVFFGGCSITLGPPAIDMKADARQPILRLGQINEELSGEWAGGGLRNYMANAFNEPGTAAMFAKDSPGLTLQVDIKANHIDDNPRLIGLGALSMVTLGIIPLHFRSEWPATSEAKVVADDGRVLSRYTVRTSGVYDIWAYPPTMFTLFAAGMKGTSHGQEVLKRTARDMVAQIVRAVDGDYEKLAAVHRSQVRARATERAAEQAGTESLPMIVSDIDEVPAPKTKTARKKAYALVIGIERYRQKLPRADYAGHDAQAVTDYLTKVLGYPEQNVVTLKDGQANKSDFEKYFEKWLPNNVESGGTVFVYFSGHGAPNPRTGDAYLVPYDGDPSFIGETGYSLKRLYAALGKLPAKEIVVALDSCFSGAGGRSVIPKGSRPLVMNLQTGADIPGNITVISASAGDQISSTYDEKGHGLFTYFLLKGIKNEEVVNADGSLEVRDLYNYMKPQVESIARKKYNNEQTPQLIEPKRN